MTAHWTPYREPAGVTLARTATIAAVLGAALAAASGGGPARWPAAAALMLWPALGGHFVELAFLNGLRPRLPAGRGVQVAARLAAWFAGGVALAAGMRWTAAALGTGRWFAGPVWWVGGLGLIVIELVAHAVLQLRGRPSFYNGRG